MPLARARLSPNRLTFYANILLILDLFLMAFVNWPYIFLLLAALGGAGWTLSATELWIAAQRAMPDWARGRLNATIVMSSQAATALGGVIWGSAAAAAGVAPTFLVAGLLAIVTLGLSISCCKSDFPSTLQLISIWNQLPSRFSRTIWIRCD